MSPFSDFPLSSESLRARQLEQLGFRDKAEFDAYFARRTSASFAKMEAHKKLEYIGLMTQYVIDHMTATERMAHDHMRLEGSVAAEMQRRIRTLEDAFMAENPPEKFK